MPVASPFEPAALLMVAAAVFDELQVTAGSGSGSSCRNRFPLP